MQLLKPVSANHCSFYLKEYGKLNSVIYSCIQQKPFFCFCLNNLTSVSGPLKVANSTKNCGEHGNGGQRREINMKTMKGAKEKNNYPERTIKCTKRKITLKISESSHTIFHECDTKKKNLHLENKLENLS